jgi:cyclopropane-fatty-acyl-phospholipid synthase
MTWFDRLARRAFLAAAEHRQQGSFELVCPDRTFTYGPPGAEPSGMMVVHDEAVFGRTLLEGELGIGESFMDGDWSSPDLVALLRLALRNLSAFTRLNTRFSMASQAIHRFAHRLRANTREGSARNIAAHYDLGNDFFRLFLDDALAYSCGWFEHESDSLERAQTQKFDRICRKLRLTSSDRLLEIGTGWGGFAAYAATHYGCRVTTTTISREQHAYSAERFDRLGEAGRRITLLLEDYRDLGGQFDKIASIEMFEAVGLAHYDEFFRGCDRLIGPAGAVLLQTITISEQEFPSYRRNADWMQAYVFPGSELACLSEMLRSLGRVTTLRAFDLEDLGLHYARTLHLWRARFHQRLDDVRALGMDDRFIRMWDLYLAYCEAAFAERHISDVQLLLTRAYHDDVYFGEPWGGGRVSALVS